MKNAIRLIGLITIAEGIFFLGASAINMGSADPIVAGTGIVGPIFGICFIGLGIGVLNENSNCIQFLMLLCLISVLMDGYNFQQLSNKTKEIRFAIDTFDEYEYNYQHQQELTDLNKWRFDWKGNPDPAGEARYQKEASKTSEYMTTQMEKAYDQHKKARWPLVLRLSLSIICLVVLFLGSGMLI